MKIKREYMKISDLTNKHFMIALILLFVSCSKSNIDEPSILRNTIVEPLTDIKNETSIFHEYKISYNKKQDLTLVYVYLRKGDINGQIFFRYQIPNMRVKINDEEPHPILSSGTSSIALYAWQFKGKINPQILFQDDDKKPFTTLVNLKGVSEVDFGHSFQTLSKSKPQFKLLGSENNDSSIDYWINFYAEPPSYKYGLVSKIKSSLISVPEKSLQRYDIGDMVNIYLKRYMSKPVMDSEGKVCGVVKIEVLNSKYVTIVN